MKMLYIDRECPDCRGVGHMEGVGCGICDQGRLRIPLNPDDFRQVFEESFSSWAEVFIVGEDNETWKLDMVRDILDRLGVPPDVAVDYLAVWKEILANPGRNVPDDVWDHTLTLLNRDQT